MRALLCVTEEVTLRSMVSLSRMFGEEQTLCSASCHFLRPAVIRSFSSAYFSQTSSIYVL